MRRQTMTLMLLVLLGLPATAAEPLTIDSCRTLAVNSNKELHMAAKEKEAACYTRKSAFTNYLPKVTASGLYMHTDKEVSLLDKEQKSTLPHIGDALSVPALNTVGQEITDALRTDTRNLGGAAVILTQPLYTGGKIRAYHKITQYAEKIAADKQAQKYQEVIVAVDETYWNIVALTARKKVAESYLGLVKTLDNDIEQMIAEGMATKADGLSVKVKVNEADVALIQVDNGIEILKMRLCQLCGLPLDSDIELADTGTETAVTAAALQARETETPIVRPELSALGTAMKISEEKVRIARSEFLPHIALTGGYAAGYPSVFNGFEKKLKGTWNVGVAVSIPILTWGDRAYKVKAARAEAAATRLHYEETHELIELQISQSRQRVTEAVSKYRAASSSQEAAEENLRYATLGLKEGVIPVSNVIEAQTAWLSAKTTMIASEIDLHLADVYLNKALGTIK